ncbi:MAG: hypothetical protein WB559_05100, partial [Candidatus Acidiferrales bacterium]
MNSGACLIFRATLSLLVLGLAAPVWSQDTGPMPPAQNSSVPAASAAPAPALAPASAPVSTSPASAASKPAMIEVPGGTHIPLVLH